MNETKKYLITLLAGLALGTAVTRAYWTKETTVVETVTKDNVVTVTRVVTKPDGTKTEDTKIVDRSVKKEKEVVTKAPNIANWHIGIGSTIDHKYSASVERRILGPVFIGVRAQSDGSLSGTIGYEF